MIIFLNKISCYDCGNMMFVSAIQSYRFVNSSYEASNRQID